MLNILNYLRTFSNGDSTLHLLPRKLVPHPGNAPGQPEDVGFTDRAASLAAY